MLKKIKDCSKNVIFFSANSIDSVSFWLNFNLVKYYREEIISFPFLSIKTNVPNFLSEYEVCYWNINTLEKKEITPRIDHELWTRYFLFYN